MFFQWRASLGGAEQFHSATLPQGGTETRTWREECSLGDELRGLADVAGSTLQARTALVMDWDSGWALDLVASPSERLRLDDQLLRHYRPLWHANVPVDVVPVTADLTGRFVDGRGSLGVSAWTEVVRPLAAETIAEFRDGPLTGRPAITRNRFGHGSAWYCATVPEPEAMRCLLHQAAASAGVLDSSPGATDDEDRLEVVERSTQRTRFRFLLSHGDLPATHMIDAPATDASTGETVEGPVTVAAGGAMVLRLGPPQAQ